MFNGKWRRSIAVRIADPGDPGFEKCDELLQLGKLLCEPPTLTGQKGKQFGTQKRTVSTDRPLSRAKAEIVTTGRCRCLWTMVHSYLIRPGVIPARWPAAPIITRISRWK